MKFEILFAKKAGIYVYEFSIGMGPKIWSKKDKKGVVEFDDQQENDENQ